jgi:hypothetical protein
MVDLEAWNSGWWLWAVIDVAAVAVLALAILYGTHMWRKRPRDARTVEASDAATWRLYHPKERDRSTFR